VSNNKKKGKTLNCKGLRPLPTSNFGQGKRLLNTFIAIYTVYLHVYGQVYSMHTGLKFKWLLFLLSVRYIIIGLKATNFFVVYFTFDTFLT